MSLKPHPIVTSEVCSVCGLEWSRHGDNPTGKTCVALLRADLSSTRAALAHRPFVQPIPYVPYAPVPWTRPFGPYWGGSTGSTWNVTGTAGTTQATSDLRLGISSTSGSSTHRTI